MLDLDKHPALQHGRFAARIWRSNLRCVHRVLSGENLFRIATRYNTTVNAIKKQNYLRTDRIDIGQELVLPSCPYGVVELKNTWICFMAVGELVYIDTPSSPPGVYALQSFTQEGLTCGSISRSGTVVLTAAL